MTDSGSIWRGVAVLFFICGTATWGCGASDSPSTGDTQSAAAQGDHDHSHGGAHEHSHKDSRDHSHGPPSGAASGHGHGAGPHEGTLADWGGGKYHVEFTVDHDQQLATVYVLGGDEKTSAPISAADGKLLLTIKEPSFQVELIATPLEGETAERASRYVGKHEKLGIVQEFGGTISGEVEGTPFAGDFQEVAHGEPDHAKPAPTTPRNH